MGRVLFLLALGVAVRADEAFSPPLIGYVFDNGVRPMVGTPGAARVLPALSMSVVPRKAAIAPGRDFAIAEVPSAETLSLVRFRADEVVPIAGTTADFQLAAFNARGSAAALYSESCSCIQVVTGLPEAPALAQRIEAAGVRALAVAREAVVAYALESETLTSDGKHWPVTVTALAYSPDGESLAVLDRERKSLSIALGDELSLVADELTEPAGLWFADASSVLVADGRSVRIIDLATRGVASADCACSADTVEPTAMKNVFRISGLANGAVWILDRSSEQSRTLFVPAEDGQ